MGGQIDTSVNNGVDLISFDFMDRTFIKSAACYLLRALLLHLPSCIYLILKMNSKRRTPTSESRALRADIVEAMKSMLDECNPYCKILRTARDRFGDSLESSNVKIVLISGREVLDKTYTLPTSSEVAALFVGDFDTEFDGRDIVVETKSKQLARVSELHPAYLPLQYPLLFPYGEDGYHIDLHLKKTTTTSKNPRFRVSMREFFAYKIIERHGQFNPLLHSGKLFQQFLVDGFTMIEAERIGYLRLNQKLLRADKYKNVAASAANGNQDADKCGKRILLPSTFVGGARYMQEKYRDAMAVCQNLGYPTLFITFTCNPKWPEITRHLQARALKTEDRADVISRIFKMKLDNLIFDIHNKNLFGPSIAVIYSIEFQKRGLPHAHILLWLKRGSKLPTTKDIDQVICAEIPDEATNPILHGVVKELMIHGPCGLVKPRSPCMEKGKCTKHFPKEFCTETYINKDGYPMYRRRDDGRYVEKNGILMDNRFVIPYNPYLLLKYQAHINVEWCNQTRAIKYLFKYVNKGNDRVTAASVESITTTDDVEGTVKVIDEIKEYYDCRYVSPVEATWRMWGFDLHHSSTTVQRLSFHLEGEQNITMEDEDDVDDVLTRPRNHTSQLLEWMKMNQHNTEAQELTYIEFPKHFVWNKTKREWTKRKRNSAVGRMHFISPSAGDEFYMRILLTVVRGATSFEDLRTVDGILYPRYQDACAALGLLEDDQLYIDTIIEASQWGSAKYMRQLFVRLLTSESFSSPNHVWLNTWHLLAEDILDMQRRIQEKPGLEMTSDQLKNQALIEIEKLLQSNGSSLKTYSSLPYPVNNNIPSSSNRLIAEELCYDTEKCASDHQKMLPSLTDEQRNVYDRILGSVEKNYGGVYFVYGFGGKIVINVASSGMAALLLEGGRTAHSRFAIPIQLHETSTCHIAADSDLAGLLLESKLIIWDEAPMLHKHCFEAFDRSMRDIARAANVDNFDTPFGGKTIVFGGDFRQVLPVIAKGSRGQIVQASLTSSSLWRFCSVLHLTKNMRLTIDSDPAEIKSIKEFSEWILKLGDGKLSQPNNGEAVIDIPGDMLLMDNLDPIVSITNAIYPSLLQNLKDVNFFKGRAILCPTNEVVQEINNHIMDILPGETKEYYSCDKICPTDASTIRDGNVSIEFLNSIKCSGLPNHVLKLKIGVPIMLLRNIDQKNGLCNGTRLQITKLGEHVIEARVIGLNDEGNNDEDRVYIPRMALTPTDVKLPFKFRRTQFPISPCFGMTINKSQE
ncbi:PREDICTED: uncharacterized protein LOC104758217 [Camelina sativa]|uniref:ATP-dependent DNA helicase n=1 Tax=Camelina sativa TaxID=90675 RepID=A0ABM0X1U0_CAMSA|nr:PREDICTED: uncharacterized protein LOC104758217 [Camelina sativa]